MSSKSPIPGANVLLLGPTGVGKTYAISTFLQTEVTPFVLFTEPGQRTLSEFNCPELHWKYVPAASPGFETLLATGKQLNTASYETLAKAKQGINKAKYGQLLEVYESCANFVCDRCGESFGSVDSWGTDRAFVLDSLSGINQMAMDLVVGAKPTKHQGEWGMAMAAEEAFLFQLTNATRCFFVLTAHLENERDELTGAVRHMPSALGTKLAPRIPRNFDDVVLCRKEDTKFTWATTDARVDLKNRNLPLANSMEPTFKTLVEAWKKAGGVIENQEV